MLKYMLQKFQSFGMNTSFSYFELEEDGILQWAANMNEVTSVPD